MISQSRYKRQGTYRIFASEFSSSSLTEQKNEEYAPAFIISKIGAKVNRALVCGVIENLERRDGDNGSSYNFSIRDPTGVIRLNIAPFQPELHATAEEMLSRFDAGERFLVLFVGKSRWYESEDGGVFTSLRVEEFCEIDKERYLNWLLSTAESTLKRIESYEQTLEFALDENEIKKSGISEDLVPAIISARNHYQNVDTEEIRLGVLKAISMAAGGSNPVEIQEQDSLENIHSDEKSAESIEAHAIEGAEPREIILGILNSNGGEVVEYEDLVGACVSAGSSREDAENAVMSLKDDTMEISEPQFGFFSISG